MNKWINFILLSSIIITGLLICKTSTLPPIETICKEFGITCNVVIYNDGVPNAYVNYNDNSIYIHKYLVDNFDYKVLFPVLLHEVGHKVLNHHQRMIEEKEIIRTRNGGDIFPGELCTLSRSYETEADIFAQIILNKYDKELSLATFFYKLSVEDKDTCSHPSPSRRIELLRRLSK